MGSAVELPDFSAQGYRVEQILGQNTTGGRVTYLATQIDSHQRVVIKQFQFATSGTSWSGYKAIQREIDMLRSLDHPGIPSYLADIEMSNGFCLVQEYIPAASLANTSPLTIPQVYQIGVSLLDILIYLQEGAAGHPRVEPILHRDIKPENILNLETSDRAGMGSVDQPLFAPIQQVYLVDFGLARIGGRYLSESTEMGGTFGFMPPEQLLKRELTKASDLYGLGMTLICLLTGTPTAQITDLIDIGTFQVHFDTKVPPALDPRFIEWLEILVKPHPKDRFPDARLALHQLQGIEAQIPAPLQHQPPPQPVLLNARTDPSPYPPESPARSLLTPSAPDLYHFQFEFPQISMQPQSGWVWFGEPQTKLTFYEWEGQGYRLDLGQGVDLELIWISGGEFWMGSPEYEPGRSKTEGPRHQILMSPFFMGRYPVTQAQWQQVARWPKVNRELPTEPSRFKQPGRPVETISWQEAMEFCARLRHHTGHRYRLPNEAEWEYACRAGTTTPFHLGKTLRSDLANYDARQRYGFGPRGIFRGETTVVGSLGLANGFGLSDLHGNVWEWCAARWHRTYAFEHQRDLRVIRGGSWGCGPRLCRSASRQAVVNYWRSDQIGLRICCDLFLP